MCCNELGKAVPAEACVYIRQHKHRQPCHGAADSLQGLIHLLLPLSLSGYSRATLPALDCLFCLKDQNTTFSSSSPTPMTFASQQFTSLLAESSLPSCPPSPLHLFHSVSPRLPGINTRHKYQQQGFVTELPLNCCFVCSTRHGLFPGENAFQYGKCYWLRYESPVFSLR